MLILECLFVAEHTVNIIFAYSNFLNKSFLDKIEVTEIGLKSEDSFGCATLGTNVMIAFFHATGGRPIRKLKFTR